MVDFASGPTMNQRSCCGTRTEVVRVVGQHGRRRRGK
jgi:hypothetical protein